MMMKIVMSQPSSSTNCYENGEDIMTNDTNVLAAEQHTRVNYNITYMQRQ